VPRDLKIIRHPSKPELLAYVESLLDSSRSPISAKTGGHIAACGSCQVAVRAIRASLEFAQQAPALEPSKELTNQILLAAQNERVTARTHPVDRRAQVWGLAKGVGFAAGLVVISTLYFGSALRETPRDIKPASAVAKPVLAMASTPSPDAILKASAEVEALVVAVSSPSGKPQGVLEREYRRQVQARKEDISRAVQALQQNPRCMRAGFLLNSNLQRQAEILRKLYAERSL
jgi:hypothetical protein